MEDFSSQMMESYLVRDVLTPSVLAVASFIDWAFTEYLLLSNVISAGIFLGMGDFVVQTIDNLLRWDGSWHYDFIRNRRTVLVGFVLGVFNHIWYAMLDSVMSKATMTTVLQKIALDQLFAGPFFCTAFFIGMGILEGKSFSEIVDEVKEKFLEVYKADWMFWPAAQFINFYLIPHRYRVFYVNLATFVWNTFLSYMKHRDVRPERPRSTPRSCQSRASTRQTASYSSMSPCGMPWKSKSIRSFSGSRRHRSPVSNRKAPTRHRQRCRRYHLAHAPANPAVIACSKPDAQNQTSLDVEVSRKLRPLKEKLGSKSKSKRSQLKQSLISVLNQDSTTMDLPLEKDSNQSVLPLMKQDSNELDSPLKINTNKPDSLLKQDTKKSKSPLKRFSTKSMKSDHSPSKLKHLVGKWKLTSDNKRTMKAKLEQNEETEFFNECKDILTILIREIETLSREQKALKDTIARLQAQVDMKTRRRKSKSQKSTANNTNTEF